MKFSSHSFELENFTRDISGSTIGVNVKDSHLQPSSLHNKETEIKH
jgi:hypothetical protein